MSVLRPCHLLRLILRPFTQAMFTSQVSCSVSIAAGTARLLSVAARCFPLAAHVALLTASSLRPSMHTCGSFESRPHRLSSGTVRGDEFLRETRDQRRIRRVFPVCAGDVFGGRGQGLPSLPRGQVPVGQRVPYLRTLPERAVQQANQSAVVHTVRRRPVVPRARADHVPPWLAPPDVEPDPRAD